MVTAKKIYSVLDKIMPFESQEKWDNSGLLVDSKLESEKVLCCLDVTNAVIDRAIEEKCKIIVSHHPIIYSAIKSISSDSILYRVIQNNISVISAHTNFDKYRYGTCFKLADFCGLHGEIEYKELGLIISLYENSNFEEFLTKIKSNVEIPVQYVKGNDLIKRVFVIGGSGKGMAEEVISYNCDCLLTGESGYHDMLDLKEKGISTVCLGHDESEKISVETLANIIKNEFGEIEVNTFIEKGITQYV